MQQKIDRLLVAWVILLIIWAALGLQLAWQ
jgi:hypothetical protein